jgi:hypothetical protein
VKVNICIALSMQLTICDAHLPAGCYCSS